MLTFSAVNPSLAAIDWTQFGVAWSIPFVGLLLSIAILPLAAPHFWHKRQGAVSGFWALAFLAPFAAFHGVDAAAGEFLHSVLLEYLPFVAMLFALYTISGGVYLKGHLRGTPMTNTTLLAIGAALASIAGTTGASVLLIRPIIRANIGRAYNIHVVIFFIFLVSNIGGSLTPLGDPPLYLGFLKGVDFFWTATHLLETTLLCVIVLLTVFFALDSYLYVGQARGEPSEKLSLMGKRNLVLLAAVIATVLGTAMWKTDQTIDIGGIVAALPDIARMLALGALAAVSLAITPAECRKGNGFTWGPMSEVAKLFLGIFVTIIPVIAILRTGADGALAPVVALVTDANGQPINAMYFWVTGALSSFLDNAPTYLVFFNAAGGDAQTLMGPLGDTLAAISAGAVFMGANTYIGNAPNFMVKAIAEEAGIKMPSFFGYMLWSGMILLPLFALVSWIFFV
jgi:Na+/H+ antiporter NhaD/arsenite permease-like protein